MCTSGSRPSAPLRASAVGGLAGIKTSKCFNCEAIGHESRDCPAPCGICGSAQHKSGYHLNDHLYVQGKSEQAATATAAAPAAAKPAASSKAAAAAPTGGRAPGGKK